MELFRSRPNLCSLFLQVLEEWGSQSLDWNMLRNEAFVDHFLRRLLVSPEIEESDIFKAGASLLQPSVGGLLIAPLLEQGGYFCAGEMESFIYFTLEGKASAWKPMSWAEIITVLEEVVFEHAGDTSEMLFQLVRKSWIPEGLLQKFLRRVWQTSRLSREYKNNFFARVTASDMGCVSSYLKAGNGSYFPPSLFISRRLLGQSEAFSRAYGRGSKCVDGEAASSL